MRVKPNYWDFRKALIAAFDEWGTLYGPSYDGAEAAWIRFECELRGVPMGYGRVSRQPMQLITDEARDCIRKKPR